MPSRVFGWIAIGVIAVLAAGMTLLAGGSITAQETGAVGYPVAIYQGGCDEVAVAPSFELGSTALAGSDEDADSDTESTLRGATAAQPVVMVEATLDTTFATLLDNQDHVVAVHDGVLNPDNIVACGAIGGVVDDGQLVVGVYPQGTSSIAGIAILDEDQEKILGIGEDQVNVTVYLLSNPQAE